VLLLHDNVHHYAHICEVISEMLVMAVTSYTIVSHRIDHDVSLNENRKLDKVLDTARIDEAQIMEHWTRLLSQRSCLGTTSTIKMAKSGYA